MIILPAGHGFQHPLTRWRNMTRWIWWNRYDQLRYTRTAGRVPSNILRSAVKKRTPVEYALVAGQGAFVPVLYGKVRVNPIIFMIGSVTSGSTSDLIFGAIWGFGEVNSIAIKTWSGVAYPDAATVFTNYTGTTSQTVNSDLVQVDANWANDMVFTANGTDIGIAYSVFSDTYSLGTSVSLPIAEIEGRKVYDPRTTTTVYSDNPALCLADFLANPVFGAGRTIDWTSVEDAADACDELMPDSSKRRILSIALTDRSSIEQWIDILRAHAGCYVSLDGNTVSLTPDRPVVSSVATLDDSDYVAEKGNVSLKFAVKSRDKVPTVVTVRYLDQRSQAAPPEWGSGGGWVYGEVSVFADGVLAGTNEWRDIVYEMPGIPTYAQARREAVERLNAATLEDLEATWLADDEGIKFQIGDVVTLSSQTRSLVGKDFRITKITQAARDFGKWRIEALEYNASTYSNNVTDPDDVNTIGFYDPASPPTPANVTATEEIYQTQTGIWATRIKLVWDDPIWPPLREFEVEFWVGTDKIHSGTTRAFVYRSPAIKEGSTYVCKVRIVSVIGAQGSYDTDNLTAQGKYLVPGDVPSISGIELGGEVRLEWEEAVDLDIWRYELRYGSTGGSWATATFIDRVDGLRKVTKEVGTGTWRFYVKAIDSVGNESSNAAYVDIVVTLDPGVLSDQEIFDNPGTVTNMVSFTLGRLDTKTLRYATDAGTACSSIFTDTYMSSYTNELQTYHGATSSDWLSESWDLGNLVTGQWTGFPGTTEVSGAAIETLRLSTDDVAWDDYTSLSVKDTYRYARMRIQTDDSGDTVVIAVPDCKAKLAAITREESGEDTSSAGAATTITCTNDYAAVASIQITAKGTAARTAVWDNLSVGDPTTFDVYIFDSGGTQVANDFYWTLKGI